MTSRNLPAKVAPFAALALLSCQSPVYGDWRFQLSPQSPCYEVNVQDGLEESSTREVLALFDCLNRHGHLDPLQYTADTLEDPSVGDNVVGTDVAQALNQINWIDAINTLGWEDDAAHAHWPILENILIEALTSQPHSVTRTAGFDFESAVRMGALPSLAPSVPVVANSALNSGQKWRDSVASAIRQTEIAKALVFADRLGDSELTTVQTLRADLGPIFGEAITHTHDSTNDRWPSEEDNSLRTLLTSAMSSEWVDAQQPTLVTLLDDKRVMEAVLEESSDLYHEGHLVPAAAELRGLIQVDASGGSLQANEVSAFEVSARLVSATNRRFSCTVDLWIGEISISVENAAVTLLETVADMDPEEALNTGSWVASLLGLSLSESVLDAIVSSGLCDGLTTQLVADLGVLEFLFSERNEHLAESLVRILHTFKSETSGPSRIPEVVDIIAGSYEQNLTRPIEEVIRDVLNSDFAQHLGHWTSVLQQIDALGLDQDTEDFNVQDVVNLLQWFFTDNGNGSPWSVLKPPLEELVHQDGLWVASSRLGTLMVDKRAQWSAPLTIIPPLRDPASVRESLDQFADWITCANCAEPVLRIASTPSVSTRLLSTERDQNGIESPTAFMARTLSERTVQDLLDLLRVLFPPTATTESP